MNAIKCFWDNLMYMIILLEVELAKPLAEQEQYCLLENSMKPGDEESHAAESKHRHISQMKT